MSDYGSDGWSSLQEGLNRLGDAVQGYGVNVEGKENQKRAFRYNQALAKDAYERQKEFYQIQTAQNRQNQLDYFTLLRQSAENAGLSAAGLMQSGGSASSLAASPASVSASGGMSAGPATRAQAMQLGLQAQQQQASIDLMRAQARNLETDAEGKEIDNSNKQEGYDLQFQNMEADYDWKQQQIAQSKASVDNMRQMFDLSERTFKRNCEHLNKQDALLARQADMVARQIFESQESWAIRYKQMVAGLNMTNQQAANFMRLAGLYQIQTTIAKHQHGAKMQIHDKDTGANGYVFDALTNYVMNCTNMTKWEAEAKIQEALSKVQGTDAYQWFSASVGLFSQAVGSVTQATDLFRSITGDSNTNASQSETVVNRNSQGEVTSSQTRTRTGSSNTRTQSRRGGRRRF